MAQKQGMLPGTKPQSIPEVEAAAEDYAAKRDARMAAGKLEKAAKDLLAQLCEKHKITKIHEYEVEIELHDGSRDMEQHFVEITKTEKIAVRKKDSVGEDKPEGEESDEQD